MAWSFRDLVQLVVVRADAHRESIEEKEKGKEKKDIWTAADYIVAWLPIVVALLLLLVLLQLVM